jgi:hypothetical protein
MRALRSGLLAAAAVIVVAMVASGGGLADDGDFAILGNKLTVIQRFTEPHNTTTARGTSQTECTATSGGANTTLDCDDPFPNNEPQIAVDPANPLHMIASSNDYGSCCDEFYTTFDGGATWATGNMSTERPNAQGPTGSDPVTAFDSKHGVALHASLNYFFGHGFTQTCRGDLVVSPSTDGGLTWSLPVIVDQGLGCDLSPAQQFNDKEWITVDNNPASKFYGRAYVTWTHYDFQRGEFVRAPIFESHSDDGGTHWSASQEISGANASLCTVQFTGAGGQCDEDQGSVPTVGPDGTVYVAFENSQNAALSEPGEEGDSQYLVVSSTNGGASWSRPSFVAGLEDGSNDYPLNEDGRQTLSRYQVRVWSEGNIVASPKTGALFLAFSDNRNGIHDVADPVTNSDVFVVSSTNGGQSWSSPSQVDAGAGDQWFPWVDVNPVTGTIGIAYNDRGDSNGTLYGAALAEGMPGSLAKTTLSTAGSDPVHSIFFQPDDEPDCAACALFHGDYIGLAYGSDGHANAVWTDMRQHIDDPDLGEGFLQFIDFARK